MLLKKCKKKLHKQNASRKAEYFPFCFYSLRLKENKSLKLFSFALLFDSEKTLSYHFIPLFYMNGEWKVLVRIDFRIKH